ncbi:hypothetical protein WA556_003602 [Blastocystis sp. ATCC 50177/Nand II]
MNPVPDYPQPGYPQPQPGYPQPGYPQPAYPQAQPVVITEDMKKMFGFAHCVHICSIIEIVLESISIVGLVFLAFPIAGKRIIRTWNDSDISCYKVWRLIILVLDILAIVGSIINGQWSGMGASIVGCAISAWLYWLVYQVQVLKAQTTASSESLAQGYMFL